jgi:hypothetical protein
MTLMPELKTVQDLIFALKKFNPHTPVLGTWEGITKGLEVYLAANGTVLVDADRLSYKASWQKLKCVECGKDARGFLPDGKPVCHTHWEASEHEYENWDEKAHRCATEAGALDPGAMASMAGVEQVDFEELDTWFHAYRPHRTDLFEDL